MNELEQYEQKKIFRQCLKNLDPLHPEALWEVLEHRPICNHLLSVLVEDFCYANAIVMYEFPFRESTRRAFWLHGYDDGGKRYMLWLYLLKPEDCDYTEHLPGNGDPLELRSWYEDEAVGLQPWDPYDKEKMKEIPICLIC